MIKKIDIFKGNIAYYKLSKGTPCIIQVTKYSWPKIMKYIFFITSKNYNNDNSREIKPVCKTTQDTLFIIPC